MPTQALPERLQPLIETMKLGHYDQAIAGLKELLAAHPDHEVALGMLAAAYFQIGMQDQARERYERLLEKYPGNALARFQLGLLHLGARPAEALEVWKPLLTVEQEFMAHFHSALAHLQLGNPIAARPLLEHAALCMPASHPLRYQLQQLRSRLAATSSVSGYTQ